MVPLVRQVLCLVTACIIASCVPSLGTPTRDVFVHNGLDEVVTVYTFDRDQRFGQMIKPGDTWRDTWMYPLNSVDRRRVRVWADDARGQLIFCADYGFSDLTKSNWRIDLSRALTCAGDPMSTSPP